MKKPTKMTTEQLNQIKKLTEDGLNPYKIATKLNIPTAVVTYHVKKLKPTNDAPVLDAYSEYKKEIASLRNRNRLLVEIILNQIGESTL